MSKKNDFSVEWDPLKPGVHDAKVTAIDFSYSELIAFRPSYETETDPPFGLSEYLPLDAPLHHPRYADTAQGKARVAQLARATGIDPKSITRLTKSPNSS